MCATERGDFMSKCVLKPDRGHLVAIKKINKFSRQCKVKRTIALSKIPLNMDPKLYDIFSKQPNPLVGNKPRLNLYRKPGYPKLRNRNSFFKDDPDTMATTGKIRVADQPDLKRGKFRDGKWVVDLAFTAMGDKGPLILFFHGVPSNRRSYYEMMLRLKPFCRCVALDMLGMGESQVDRKALVERYKNSTNPKGWQFDCWLWEHDADYIKNFMDALYPGEKFIFFADDWGGGSAVRFAAKYPELLLLLILLDPVALDGYPVREIMAIGRTSGIPDMKTFQMAMGAFDQTSKQIYKTMVHKPDYVMNQYVNWIDTPYAKTDYVKGFTSTEGLKWNNLRNLADRSFTLGGPQLLPFHPTKNPMGVKYSRFKAPVLLLWGALDNMMPEAQRHRLRAIIMIATGGRVRVQTRQIPKAGHFAAWDKPDLVAADTLDYILEQMGPNVLADFFFGFKETRIWKGDEKQVLEELRVLRSPTRHIRSGDETPSPFANGDFPSSSNPPGAPRKNPPKDNPGVNYHKVHDWAKENDFNVKELVTIGAGGWGIGTEDMPSTLTLTISPIIPNEHVYKTVIQLSEQEKELFSNGKGIIRQGTIRTLPIEFRGNELDDPKFDNLRERAYTRIAKEIGINNNFVGPSTSSSTPIASSSSTPIASSSSTPIASSSTVPASSVASSSSGPFTPLNNVAENGAVLNNVAENGFNEVNGFNGFNGFSNSNTFS